MYQSEQINELVGALSKAQGEMNNAKKDSSNPFYNSKYADLGSVWEACREALSKNGLAIIQTTNNLENELYLVTTLAHSSGQWMKSYLPIKYNDSGVEINKYGKETKINPLHKMGSSLTYLRRYALSAIVGVAPDDDDDGNSGGQTYVKEQKKPIPDVDLEKKIIDRKKEICELAGKENKEDLVEYINRIKSIFKSHGEDEIFLSCSSHEFVEKFHEWKKNKTKVA